MVTQPLIAWMLIQDGNSWIESRLQQVQTPSNCDKKKPLPPSPAVIHPTRAEKIQGTHDNLSLFSGYAIWRGSAGRTNGVRLIHLLTPADIPPVHTRRARISATCNLQRTPWKVQVVPHTPPNQFTCPSLFPLQSKHPPSPFLSCLSV
jgi:hypothetical protein